MKKAKIIYIFLIISSFGTLFPQNRFSVSGGMGINYSAYIEINDYLSHNWNYKNNKYDFSSLASFFISSGYDISDNYNISFETRYSLTSFSKDYSNGRHELNMQFISPGLGFDYYFGTEYWRFSFGGGLNFNVAYISEKAVNQVIAEKYQSKGFTVLIKTEGNTAISKDIFIVLGADLFISDYQDITLIRSNPTKSNLLSLDNKGFGLKIGLKYFL